MINDEELDDLIVHFSRNKSQRWISQCLHVGRKHIRSVLAAHRGEIRILHQLGRPSKAIAEIKKWILTDQLKGAMGVPLQEHGLGVAFSKGPIIN
jgi:hypothetical protein